MIEKGLGTPGGASTVELLAERGAHGNRGVDLIELEVVCSHLVDMRGGAVHAAVATKAVPIYVVSQQENEIRLGGVEERACQRQENENGE